MRLRRETGDFNIVLADGTYTARKALPAENFVGEIVKNGDVLSVVVKVEATEGGATLTTAAGDTLTYVKATGVITLNEQTAATGASE